MQMIKLVPGVPEANSQLIHDADSGPYLQERKASLPTEGSEQRDLSHEVELEGLSASMTEERGHVVQAELHEEVGRPIEVPGVRSEKKA